MAEGILDTHAVGDPDPPQESGGVAEGILDTRAEPGRLAVYPVYAVTAGADGTSPTFSSRQMH